MKSLIFYLFLFFSFDSYSQFSIEHTKKLETNKTKWVYPKWNNKSHWEEYKLGTVDKTFVPWTEYTQTWDGKQFLLFFISGISGIAHGMREAYHANPYVFEELWGVDQYSFFGSDAWIRNYRPDGSHKSEWLGNIGRDFWHTADEVSLLGITTPIVIGLTRHQPTKFKIANSIVCLGTRTLFAFITYKAL